MDIALLHPVANSESTAVSKTMAIIHKNFMFDIWNRNLKELLQNITKLFTCDSIIILFFEFATKIKQKFCTNFMGQEDLF